MYDMSSHGFQWAHDKCTSLLLKRSKISLFIELQTWFCFTRNSRYITPRSLALTYWKQAACKQACLMWICWPWHNRHGWLGVKNHVQISLSLSLLPDIRKTGRVTTGMQARFLYCQTRKRLKRTLFIRTKHDMRIFGVISCFFFSSFKLSQIVRGKVPRQCPQTQLLKKEESGNGIEPKSFWFPA